MRATRLERARREFERYGRRERRRWRAALRAARDTYTREGARIADEESYRAPSAVLRRVRSDEQAARRRLLDNRDERVAHATDPVVARIALALALISIVGMVVVWVVGGMLYEGPPIGDDWRGALVVCAIAASCALPALAVRWAAASAEHARAQRGRQNRVPWLRDTYDRAFRNLAEVEHAQGLRGVCEVIVGGKAPDEPPLASLVNASDDLLAVPFPAQIDTEAARLEAGDPRTVAQYDIVRDLRCRPSQVHIPAGDGLAHVDAVVSR